MNGRRLGRAVVTCPPRVRYPYPGRSRVAQSAERPAVNRQVIGSSPIAGATEPPGVSPHLRKRRKGRRLRLLSHIPRESARRRVSCHFSAASRPGCGRLGAAGCSRLAQTAGAAPSGVFTSDLSVSEYVLLGEAGFEPLGFVVGSSIYHIGLQVGRWSQNQELQVLTQAMYNARELAMTRMQAEADHLGADGIVGVQLRIQSYVWGQGVLEFIATGTAVRALGSTGGGTDGAHRAPDGRAFTSDLSAQDFFRLLAAGAVPVAFVLGTCVYHIAHQSAMQSCARPARTRKWWSSPRASTRPASSRWPGCRRRRRRRGPRASSG